MAWVLQAGLRQFHVGGRCERSPPSGCVDRDRLADVNPSWPVGDLVLLANPHLVLEPHFYRCARCELLAVGDACGKVFLNASHRLRALACRPSASHSHAKSPVHGPVDGVVRYRENANSSYSRMIRSQARQRTTPWIAGVGPSSTIWARNALCSSSTWRSAWGSNVYQASGPCSLKRITQSRSVWRSIPPVSLPLPRCSVEDRSDRQNDVPAPRPLSVFGQTANFGARIVCFHCNRSTHDKPPSVCQVENHFASDLEIPEKLAQ